MDFSQTQRDPTRKFVGIGAVLVFHIIIVYALDHRSRAQGCRGRKRPDRSESDRRSDQEASSSSRVAASASKAAGASAALHTAAGNQHSAATDPRADDYGSDARGAAGATSASNCRARACSYRRRPCKARRLFVPTIGRRWVRSRIRAKLRSRIFRAKYWPNSHSARTGRYATLSSRVLRTGYSTGPQYK